MASRRANSNCVSRPVRARRPRVALIRDTPVPEPARSTRGIRSGRLLAIAALLFSIAGGSAPRAEELYFIDALSQIDDRVNLATVVQMLERGGVTRTILSTTMRASQDEVIQLARRDPGQIIPAVRTKGYITNRSPQRYQQILNDQILRQCRLTEQRPDREDEVSPHACEGSHRCLVLSNRDPTAGLCRVSGRASSFRGP